MRRLVHALVGAWAGDGVILLAEVTGPAAGLVALLATLLGASIGWFSTRNIAPWPDQDVRDGAIGWGIVAAAVLVLSCAALPMPWPPIAAAAAIVVVSLTVTTIRRSIGPTDNA